MGGQVAAARLAADEGSASRQLWPAHMRETAACALEHAPALHDPGDAVALQLFARFLVPGVCQKTRTTLAFDRHHAGHMREHLGEEPQIESLLREVKRAVAQFIERQILK